MSLDSLKPVASPDKNLDLDSEDAPFSWPKEVENSVKKEIVEEEENGKNIYNTNCDSAGCYKPADSPAAHSEVSVLSFFCVSFLRILELLIYFIIMQCYSLLISIFVLVLLVTNFILLLLQFFLHVFLIVAYKFFLILMNLYHRYSPVSS